MVRLFGPTTFFLFIGPQLTQPSQTDAKQPQVYEDTLVDPVGGAIYIGEFVGEVPHGRGTLALPATLTTCRFMGSTVLPTKKIRAIWLLNCR